jgi:hypothetical protein
MKSQKLVEVIAGDDETIADAVLRFAGMMDEFEDVELCELKTSDILEVARDHADDSDEEEFDNGLPGGCCGLFRFYAKDPEKFRRVLARKLRPMCRELRTIQKQRPRQGSGSAALVGNNENDLENMEPSFEGPEEEVAAQLLRLSGLEDEFPDTDLEMLDLPDIMDAACNHADDFRQEDLDEGMPGNSCTYVTIRVRDRDAFLTKLADDLRPLCRELESEI